MLRFRCCIAKRKRTSFANRSMSEITFLPFENSERYRTSEIMKRIPDITKAYDILGYRPRICLNEGIKTISGE